MTAWRTALWIFGLLIVQTSVVPNLGLTRARPDLLLLLTIYVGLSARAERATLTGFFSGIAQDAFSGELPGLNSFAKSIVGFLSPSVRGSFIVTNFFVQLLAVALLTIVHGLVLHWMGQAIHQKASEVGMLQFVSTTVAPQVLSNLLFWVVLRPLFRKTLPPPEEY